MNCDQESGGQGAVEDSVQDGHLAADVIPRGADIRGVGSRGRGHVDRLQGHTVHGGWVSVYICNHIG